MLVKNTDEFIKKYNNKRVTLKVTSQLSFSIQFHYSIHWMYSFYTHSSGYTRIVQTLLNWKEVRKATYIPNELKAKCEEEYPEFFEIIDKEPYEELSMDKKQYRKVLKKMKRIKKYRGKH